MPREQNLRRVENTFKEQLDFTSVVFEGALICELTHQEDSSSIWLFEVFWRGRVGNVFEIETSSLIRDFEKQVLVLNLVLNEYLFVCVEPIPVHNGIVYGFCHSDEDIAIALIVKGEIIANFINQPLDDGDVFRL